MHNSLSVVGQDSILPASFQPASSALRRALVLFFLPLLLLCAADKPNRAAAKAPASTSASVTIPTNAVEIEPHLFRHTAPDGKIWLYRKTPFGISKTEQKSNAGPQPVQNAAARTVTAIEIGDIVRFERATPMGRQTWEKKRTELTAEEKTWLEKSAQPSGLEKSAQPAGLNAQPTAATPER